MILSRLRNAWQDLKDIGDPFDIPDWPNDSQQDTHEETDRG